MSTLSIPNVWHHRRVADTASKACWICYKPSSSVLTTPATKDYFYICPGHLTDRGFCSPIINEAEIAAKKKKEEMDKEIEKVKVEYEEKRRKEKEKKEKEKKNEKEKEKTQDKDNDPKHDDEKTDKKAEEPTKEKPDSSSGGEALSTVGEASRVYTLHKKFYQMRLDRIRNAEIAKRNRERLKDPTTFPSVPQGFP